MVINNTLNIKDRTKKHSIPTPNIFGDGFSDEEDEEKYKKTDEQHFKMKHAINIIMKENENENSKKKIFTKEICRAIKDLWTPENQQKFMQFREKYGESVFHESTV